MIAGLVSAAANKLIPKGIPFESDTLIPFSVIFKFIAAPANVINNSRRNKLLSLIKNVKRKRNMYVYEKRKKSVPWLSADDFLNNLI